MMCIARWNWAFALVLAAGIVLSFARVEADEIVLNGRHYRDVLVVKTPSTYYVQLPKEGRTISSAVGEVDAATVSINDDPYYRDRLKDEYRSIKARREAGEVIEEIDDPAFRAEGSSSDQIDINSLLGAMAGGGGGAPAIARTAVESMLAGFGMQFQPGAPKNGQPTVVANMPDGTSITLFGPPEKLMGLGVKGSAATQMVDVQLGQLQMLLAQVAPQQAGQLTAKVAEAKQSGRAESKGPGGTMVITMKESGGQTAFTIETMFK